MQEWHPTKNQIAPNVELLRAEGEWRGEEEDMRGEN